MASKVVLITGAAGFIGFHLANALLIRGDSVIGLDNLNDYYDVNLKLARLEKLKSHSNFSFVQCDLLDKNNLLGVFKKNAISSVVNLAAQAGVRYSIDHPDIFVQSNMVGFLNVLECCRHFHVKHLVYASTSSVYGAHTKQPFTEHDHTDHPMTLYAATKKSNELMAHSYASLYQLPVTGLRFFTVYGPWGRPDMALFLFTKNILEKKPVNAFNHGKMIRDFTYIDDIVSGIILAMDNPAKPNLAWDAKNPDPATSYAPYRIYNIGGNKPEQLMHYVHAIEDALGIKAIFNYLPMQLGDVPETHADISLLNQDRGYLPSISIKAGVKNFVRWYCDYYQVN
ncbi:MAG: NAD-dependent epimerase [Gammaproteobacteria bacterium]|nr:NAD-dependent epimerase [Gammaproteobacteria bacterium]